MDLVPVILQNALRDFKFERAPLRRLAEGQELVLTFLKPANNQPTAGARKKKVGIRKRKPAPSADEWPRQPRPAKHFTDGIGTMFTSN